MIAAAVPFLHIHVWEILVRCDTKSTITVIHEVMRLKSCIGLAEWICARAVCWIDWRLWNEDRNNYM